MNGRARPYYFRRCKISKWLETKTNINSLPDDIVIYILVHLPAQDFRNAISLVCRKWYKMIHTHKFIHVHLQHSTHGLLIQDLVSEKAQLTFIAIRKGRIEISRLSYESGHRIWSSCNGLILESERQNHRSLFITNPATMQHFALPPFFSSSGAHSSAIAYAADSMEYKVVGLYHSFSADYSKSKKCLAILTVGVDNSWRRVDIQHLSPEARKLLYFEPLVTEGFVHWAHRDTYVLTLNVETEIIKQISIPLCCDGERLRYHYYYFPMGSYLSLLILCGSFSWDVWEMKPETGEWTKLLDIDLKAQKHTIERLLCNHDESFKPVGYMDCGGLRPVGWLKYQEVLVFNVLKLLHYPRYHFDLPRYYIAYNVCSTEIDVIELDSNRNAFIAHRNSLVWLDGC